MSLSDKRSPGEMGKDSNSVPMQTATQPIYTQRAAADTNLTATTLNTKTTHVTVWALAASAATTVAMKLSTAASGGVTLYAGQVMRIPVAGVTQIFTAAYASTADIQIVEERLE